MIVTMIWIFDTLELSAGAVGMLAILLYALWTDPFLDAAWNNRQCRVFQTRPH